MQAHFHLFSACFSAFLPFSPQRLACLCSCSLAQATRKHLHTEWREKKEQRARGLLLVGGGGHKHMLKGSEPVSVSMQLILSFVIVWSAGEKYIASMQFESAQMPNGKDNSSKRRKLSPQEMQAACVVNWNNNKLRSRNSYSNKTTLLSVKLKFTNHFPKLLQIDF